MTHAGELNRRVTFYLAAEDANGDRLGTLEAVCTRDARVRPLKGSEKVQEQRLLGQQPVVITVRRDSTTKSIDNSYEVSDARDATINWDIKSTIITEDLQWVEILAVEKRGQPL